MSARTSQRRTLLLFIFMVFFLVAQAIWWYVFMESLVTEKMELSQRLGASPELMAEIEREVNSRKLMVGLEGAFFFVVLLGGLWIVYRALLKQQQLQRQQENFVLAVTHELKTPLTSLNIYLGGLLSGQFSESDKTGAIPKMKAEVNRLQARVQNLLDIARFENIGDRAGFREFNLSRLVNNRLAAFKDLTDAADCHLETSVDGQIKFCGDQGALSRALDAILENAIIHNKSRRVHISVRLYADQPHIVLEITDDGVGLNKNELHSVFERFYRADYDPTRPSCGTGLGLYIAREIIKSHGGSISAHSEGPNRGTKFFIKLKLR